jgi:hypothetical protein
LIGSDVFHGPTNTAKINIFGAPSALPTADYVYVAPNSKIMADSLLSGNAGTVEIWANVEDKFYGIVSAQAKGLSGNGGNVETSGEILDTTGATVIASAKNGQAGLWYLDPTTLAVTNALAAGYNTTLQSGTNLSISATGNVNFQNTGTPITWGTAASFTASADTGLIGSGIGTILWTAGATINSTGAGNVFFNYSPSTFETAQSFTGLVNMTGTGTFNPTMQVNLAAAPTVHTISNSDATNFNTALTGGTNVLAYDFNTTVTVSNNLTPITWSTGNMLTIEALAGSSVLNLSTSNAIESTGAGVTNLTAANNINLSASSAIGNSGSGATNLISGNIINLSTSSAISNGGSGATNLTASNNINFTASTGINNSGSGAVNLTANNAVYFTNLDFGVISAAGAITTTATNLYINNNTSTITISDADAKIINNALGANTNVSMTSVDNINFNNTSTPTPISWSTAANLTAIADSGEANVGSIGFGGVYSTTPSSTATLTSSGSGNLNFYYDSINAAPNEVATNFAGVVTMSGTGKLNTFMKVFEPASTTINSTEAAKLTAALDTASTSVTLYGASNIIFGNGGSPITWANLDTFTVNAGTVSSGTAISFPTAGTIIQMTGGGTTNLRADGLAGATTGTLANNTVSTTFTGTIVNTGSTVNVFYNPPSGFATPVSYAGLVSSGNAPTAYMLVYNNLASHDLSNLTTLTGNYALAQNLGSNLTVAPIGDRTTAFSGNFTGYDYYDNSGANYTISSLSFLTGNRDVGLFGFVTGTLQNISLVNPNLTSTFATTNLGEIGAIVGDIKGASSGAPAHLIGNFNVTNTSGNNAITSGAGGDVGGLIGALDNFSLLASGSTFSTAVTGGTFSVISTGSGANNIGGLIGFVSGSIVSAADFQATSMTNNATVIAKNASSNIGGIFGNFARAGVTVPTIMINNGVVETNVGSAVTISSIGGIGGTISAVNTFTGSMTNTASIGANLGVGVITSTATGGLLGSVTGSTFSGNMLNSGNVTDTGNTLGGLIGNITGGSFTGSMIDSGNVSGALNVGGLIGFIGGVGTSISGVQSFQTTSAITVSGAASVGGLIGAIGANTVFSRTGTVSNAVGTTVTDTVGQLGGLFGLITGAITTAADFSPTALTNNAAVIQTAGTGGGDSGEGGIVGQFNKTGLTIATNMTNNGAIESNATATVTVFDMGGVLGNLIVANTFTGSMSNTGNIGLALGTGAVTVSGAGGVIGAASAGSFTGNMTDSGSVFGTVNTGGLIGSIAGTGTSISGTQNFQTTSAITVSGTTSVGGLIGSIGANTVFSPTGTISNVVGTTVIGTTGSIGGFFGLVSGAITTAADFAPSSLTNNATVIETAATAGNTGIGGIFGTFSKAGLTIATNMTNSGAIETNSNTNIIISNMGGITGYIGSASTFTGTMSNTASIGTGIGTGGITANDFGGIIGQAVAGIYQGNMTGSGNVVGSNNVGGLIGLIGGVGTSISGTQNFQTTSAISVTGLTNVGGLIGQIGANTVFSPTGTVSNVAGTKVTGATGSIGGLFGFLTGVITTSADFAPIAVTNNATVIQTAATAAFQGTGGIFGAIAKSGLTIPTNMTNNGLIETNSNSAITITNIAGIAGISGANTFTGSMSNTNSVGLGIGTGVITRNDSAGLIAFATGTYQGSMSDSGNVFGSTNVGSIMGQVSANTVFSSSATISNTVGTTVTGTTGSIGGLFGLVTGAITTSADFSFTSLTNNATVIETAATTASTGIGGIFGTLTKTGLTIATNMTNNGLIETNSNSNITIINMGGIVGYLGAANTFTGTMSNTVAIGTGIGTGIITINQAGGLLGNVIAGSFSGNMADSGNVSGSSNVGGLIGFIGGVGTSISGTQNFQTTSAITVTGTTNVGGLIGQIGANTVFSPSGTVSNVTGTTVTGTTGSIGGFFGLVNGAINAGGGLTDFVIASLTNNATVIQTAANAGLVGIGGIFGAFSKAGLTIATNMTNNGLIETNSNTNITIANMGGIAGYVNGTNTFSGSMTNAASVGAGLGTGTITRNQVGGLLGNIAASSFSGNMADSGNVSGSSNVGGLIGFIGGVGTSISGTQNFQTTSAITVTGTNSVGGLIGQIGANTVFSPSGTVSNVTGTTVTGTTGNIGGLFGIVNGAINAGGGLTDFVIASLTNNATVIVTAATTGNGGIGGIFGSFTKTGLTLATNMSNNGPIETNSNSAILIGNMGGIAGYVNGTNTFSGSMTDAVSVGTGLGTGAITINQVGGLFGNVTGITLNGAGVAFNTTGGSVIGATNVGGLIGSLTNSNFQISDNVTHDNIYSQSAVSGSFNMGGLFGVVSNTASFAFDPGVAGGTLTNKGTFTITASGRSLGGMVGSYSVSGTSSYNMTNTASGSINTGSFGSFWIGGIIGLFGTGTLTGALSNNAALTTPLGTNVGGYIGNMGATAVLNSSVLTLNTQNIDGGDNGIGGIVGSLSGSLIGSGGYENTGNIGTLSTSNLLRNIGGIVGYFPSGTISASLTSSGNIGNPSTSSANYGVGGLIGFMNGGTLSGNNAFHTFGSPLIQGNRIVGGLLGAANSGSSTMNFQLSGSTNIYSTGSVIGTGSGGNIGGIAGCSVIISPFFGTFSPSTTGTLTNNATVTATIAGTPEVGGIFGLFNDTGTGGTNAYTMVNNASGKILFSPTTQTGINRVGGIVGEFASGTLTGSLTNYATIGDASSVATNVGGIVGLMDGGILNSSSLTSNSINIYGSSNLGGIVGGVTSGGLIGSGGYANYADIIGTGSAEGGLIGAATGTFSIDMTSSGNVSGSSAVGGLIGQASGATFNGVGTQFNTTAGSVTATSSGSGLVGGLIGSFVGNSVFTISDNATHNNIYSMSAVTGPSFVGGIFGLVQSGTLNPGVGGGTLTNYGTVTVNGAGTWIGGIIGFFQAANTSAYNMTNKASGAISSGAFVANDIGGIVGGLGTGGIFTGILENDATINTPNSSTVGGIAGASFGTINNSMTNIGNITGTQYVGGLVGFASGSPLSGTMTSSGLLTATSNGLGGVAGYMTGTSSIALDSVTVTNTFSGTSDIGGVVGYTDGTDTFSGTFTNGGNALTITNGTNIGGIMGRANHATLGAIITDATLNSTNGIDVGGIAGNASNSTFGGNLTANGNTVVTGNSSVGGLVGYALNDTFTGINAFAGIVTGNLNTGGITGTLNASSLMTAELDGSSGHGTVYGTNATGGIAGTLINGASINQAVNTSNNTVVGVNSTGGIAGTVDATSSISNALFGGTLSATGNSVGGIAGVNDGVITNVLSVGRFIASGASAIGALVGTNNGTISTYGGNSTGVYDIRSYGYSIHGVGAGNPGGTGSQVSAALAGPSFYTALGWNFTSIWATSTGNYPVLQFCPSCSVTLRPAINFSLLYSQINQVLTDYQLQNIPSISAEPTIILDANSLAGILLNTSIIPTQLLNTFLKTLCSSGNVSAAFLSQVMILQTQGVAIDTPAALSSFQADIGSVVMALADYYHNQNNQSGGNGCSKGHSKDGKGC